MTILIRLYLFEGVVSDFVYHKAKIFAITTKSNENKCARQNSLYKTLITQITHYFGLMDSVGQWAHKIVCMISGQANNANSIETLRVIKIRMCHSKYISNSHSYIV